MDNLKFALECGRIALDVDHNDHNAAYIRAAELLVECDHPAEILVKKFTKIKELCDIEKCTPHHIDLYRYEVYNDLKKFAEMHLGAYRFRMFIDAI